MRITHSLQRAGFALLLGLAVATCRDDPTGPGRGYRASLSLAPVLPQQAANLAAFGLAIDSLRVVIVRPPADTVVDTTVAFAADQDSLSLAISLDLTASSELFDVAIELRGGGFALFSAAASVVIEEGGAGANEPLEVGDFLYTGPGAGITALVVTPLDSVIRLGDSLRFRVDALAGGVPVPQFYVSWSTSNEILAPINAHGVLTAPVQRGAVTVTATTPNGISGSVPVTFVPVPTAVVAVPPIPDNVLPGVPIGPLRARVLAADGLGVKGIAVSFQATTGGGAVTNAVVVSDSGGFAETPATSGTGPLSVFTATVAGIATPATFNVNVVVSTATQLLFTLAPTGAVVDLPLVVAIEVRDAQGNVVADATDPVTIALGANPGGAALGGTLTVNAVQGLAVFADLTINQPGSGYTLVAAAPGLTPDTTPAFDVIPGFTGRLWTNAAGGNWSDPANWSGGIVPGVNDTVYIALDGDYTVTLDVNASVDALVIGGGTGTQRLLASSRTLQLGTILTIGPTGIVDLTNSTLGGAAATVFNSGQIVLQAVAVAPSLLNFSASGLTVRGGTTIAGTFTNGIDALTRIEADPFCCTAALTVNGGFTNMGLLELTAVNGAGTTATLSVPTGTAFNLAGGTIASLPGSGGSRVLDVALDNSGTLLIEHDLTLSQASAAHVNTGSIQLGAGNFTVSQSGTAPSFTTSGGVIVGSGRTLAVSGGSFAYASPAVGGLAGLGTASFANTLLSLGPDLTNDSLSLAFMNTTVNGPGTLTNAAGRTLTMQQTAINAPFVNQGLFVVRGASSLAGTVTTAASSTMRLEADPFCCTSTLTVATGFTNNGLIELTAINGAGTTATLAVTSGTLVNAAGATIVALPGSGGARDVQAQFSNDGTLLVAHDLTLSKTDADYLNSGLIQLTGGNLTLVQSGGSPTFATPGSIVVGAGRTFTVSGGFFQYSSAAAGGLAGTGSVNFSGASLALLPDLTHDTLTLSFVNSTVTGPGTLTIAAGGTMTIQQTAINAPFVNQGVLVARGVSSIGGGLTTAAGSTMQIQADPFCCSASLTVTGGFTNNGLLELTAVNGIGTTAALDVPSGFLVNAPGATVAIRAGTGGPRNLQAALNNQGLIVVEQDAVLNAGSADHVNSGSIQLTGGGLTLLQTGTTPTFTTTGSILVGAGRVLQVNGGAFNYSNAAPGGVSGLGTVAFSGSVFNLTPALGNDSLTLSFVNTTVSGGGVLTNAAGRTLPMQQTALNTPFVNQGLLVARGGSSLGSSVTAAAGGTIRVEADPTCCTANLSVANPFTNDGLIELTSINGTGTTASLDVAGGLTNGTGGTIALLPGTGGARTLPTALINNGLIAVGTDATIGTANASYVNNGTIDVSGGTLTLPLTGTTPVFTNQGAINVGAGRTISVQGGAAGTFANAGTGTLAGSGTFDVSSTTFTNNGTVAPGGSPGALTFIGTYAMGTSAVLSIELGGPTAGTQYDQVVVGGTGTLAGTLNVTLINGFTPSIGQVFTVVSGAAITGVPTSLNLPSVAGGVWVPALGAAGLQVSLVSASALLPVIWTNPAGGNWSVGANWSTGTPPGPNDSAVINLGSPVTVVVDVAATAAFLDIGTVVGNGIKTLVLGSPTLTLSSGGIVGSDGVVNLSAGTLAGGGTLQVNGALNWTGGSITGAGIVQVGAAGTLTLGGAATKSLNSRTIQTAGTVSWTGAGQIGAGGGAVVHVQNGGTFAANGDAIINHTLGGGQPRVIVDAGGTFSRSAGTGVVGLFVPFDNAGTVALNTGTLELRGGTSTGSFNVAAAAQLNFAAGTSTLGVGAQLAGSGIARINGGTVVVEGAATVPVNQLLLQSGALHGPGTIEIQDSLVWSGGALGASGTTAIPSGATLRITGNVSFNGATIDNAGAVIWTAGNISSGNGAALLNQSGGIVDLQAAAASWSYNLGGVLPRLDNFLGGAVQRTAGAGLVDVRAALNNAGSLQVLAGPLALNGGGTSDGAFTVASGGELGFGGTHALLAGSGVAADGIVSFLSGITTIAGAYDVTGQTLVTLGSVAFNTPDTARITTLNLQGGTLGGSGVVLVRGVGNWTGGVLGGPGVLRVPAGVTWNVVGPVTFTQRTIANAGQVVWSAGNLSSGLGAVLRNESGAVLDIQTSTGWFHNQGGAVPLIDNLAGGVVRRTTAAGSAILNVPLANTGTLDVQTGTLVLNAGAASGGTHTVATGATLQYGGTGHSWATGAAFTGTGRVLIPAGATVRVDALAPDSVDARWIDLTGGIIGGAGVLRMADSLVWTGGQLIEAGVVRIPTGAELRIRGTASKTFSARTIANAGLVSWTGTGMIASGDNAALVNESGATFQLESDGDWVYNQGGIAPRIDNLAGALIKRGSATSAITVAAVLNNDGTLDLQTGSVNFTGGGSSKGLFLLTAPGVLSLGGGSHTVDAGAVVSGTGSFQVPGGTVTVTGDYNVTGATRVNGGTAAFSGSKPAEVTTLEVSSGVLGGVGLVNLSGAGTWTGGTMTGTGQLRVLVGASFTIDSKDPKVFTQRTILNAGLVTWKGTGAIASGLGAVLTNDAGATFEVQDDAAWQYSQGGAVPVVNNAGSLKRSVTSGSASIQAAVNNTGNVDVTSGTLTFSGGGSNTGLYAVSSGAVLDFGGGTHAISGATSRVNGAGSVSFTAGAVTLSSTAAGAYDITGTTLVDGGTATFNTPDTTRFTTLLLRNGILGGTANMVVRGSGLWTGGGLTAPTGLPAAVVLRLPTGVAFTINGTAAKQLTARTILVMANASANWLGGNVLAASGATLDVQSSGVFNVSAPAAWSVGAPQPFIFIRDRANMNVTTAGTTTLAAGAVFNNQGTLDIAAGATLKVGSDLNQLGGSTLQGDGVLDVVGNSKVVNQGTVRPGTNGPGILTILGNWPQGSGTTLVLEIFGPTVGSQHDRLVVSGLLTSGGAMQLVGNGSFQPRTTTIEIVTYGSRTGQTFATSLIGGLLNLLGLNYNLTGLVTVW